MEKKIGAHYVIYVRHLIEVVPPVTRDERTPFNRYLWNALSIEMHYDGSLCYFFVPKPIVL